MNNSLILQSSNRSCVVCEKTDSAYRCPRCSSPYCSVKCYSGHGLDCTEAFFKEQCMSVPGPKPTQALKEAIQRNLEDIAEDEEIGDWECNLERLQDLALKNELNEQHLSEDIREQFQQCMILSISSSMMIHSLSDLKEACSGRVEVETWRPWWISEFDRNPLELLDDFHSWKELPCFKGKRNSSRRERQFLIWIPAIIENSCEDRSESPMLSITPATTKAISAELHNHILDGVLVTAFALRRFDGDLLSDVIDLSSEILSASSILSTSESKIFSGQEVISGFLERIVPKTCLEFGLVIIYDCICILNSRSLTRIYMKLIRCLKALVPLLDSKKERASMYAIERKAEFFASLSHNLKDEDYERLHSTVVKIWKEKCRDCEENQSLEKRRKELRTEEARYAALKVK
jgi:hypothetical protein